MNYVYIFPIGPSLHNLCYDYVLFFLFYYPQRPHKTYISIKIKHLFATWSLYLADVWKEMEGEKVEDGGKGPRHTEDHRLHVCHVTLLNSTFFRYIHFPKSIEWYDKSKHVHVYFALFIDHLRTNLCSIYI